MARSEARITIDRSGHYLRQLCQRFAHMVPTTHTRRRGQIVFAAGTCKLEAKDGLLTVVVEAEDEAIVAKLEQLVALQLQRFAFRDWPTISWANLERLKF